jgi:4-carboxymuconolactone decarboxylase
MRNEERYNLGKKIRREVVGGEYDDVIQDLESDFSQPIRDWTTENVWGTVWADETLSRKTRSMLNVALTTALRCSHETKVHIRGAINNGCTKEEIRAVLMQVAGVRRRARRSGSGARCQSSVCGGSEDEEKKRLGAVSRFARFPAVCCFTCALFNGAAAGQAYPVKADTIHRTVHAWRRH